jgi:hypothetical protein
MNERRAWLAAWVSLNRTALLLVGLATVGLAGVSLVAALALNAATDTCRSQPGLLTTSCVAAPGFSVLYPLVEAMSWAFVALPIAVGVLFGAVIVGREADEGTLPLTWSLAPRRLRWLSEQLVLAALVVLVVSVVAGLIGLLLAQAAYPGTDLAASFHAFGRWGPITVFRGALSLGAGLLAGVVLRRVVPALLLASLFSVVFVAGVEIGMQRTYPSELWVAHSMADSLSGDELDLTSGKVLAPDGHLIEIMDAVAQMPPGMWGGDDATANAWLAEHFPPAYMIVPGTAVPAVLLRESLVLSALAAAAIAVAAVAIRRFRVS